MTSYIIGIDGGTQSTKVTIFDLAGNEICSHSERLKLIELHDGGVALHPGDDLWESLQVVCQETMRKFSGDPADIIGIGLGSIRCCRALLKEDGNLASPVQSWMDERLSRPYEHEDDDVRWVTTTTGYLTHRLTGETKDTRSNYVGPWPIDPDTLEWYPDGEVFDSYTTPREMLFELVDPATVMGTLTEEAATATGMPAGLPVVSTANDKAVEGLGAGLLNDGRVLVSLGSYITSMMLGSQNAENPSSFFVNPGATPGEFMYESNGIRRGMTTISWVKDLLGKDLLEQAQALGKSPEELLGDQAAEVPPGSEGLYTLLHWLAPPSAPHERGMMLGFSGVHQGPHMFRSVMEGIAMTMKNNAQAMCDELGVEMKSVTISGGGSNSPLFMQILADVFGVPASRNVINGAAGLGAAICCALGVDAFSARDEAVESMVRIRDTFDPIPENVELYRRLNAEVYQHLNGCVDDLLKVSHEILG